jgi:nucleotidyltransferase substrate binding protein (TIGR01987 family)
MPLALDSLIKSINSLQRGLNETHANTTAPGVDVDMQEILRAGIIHQFTVAYEQCWKFIQRWIRENRTVEGADRPRTRKELFRMAAAAELISDPVPWFEFGDARNLSAHTYDGAQAALVYDAAKRFLPHALELLSRLQEKND